MIIYTNVRTGDTYRANSPVRRLESLPEIWQRGQGAGDVARPETGSDPDLVAMRISTMTYGELAQLSQLIERRIAELLGPEISATKQLVRGTAPRRGGTARARAAKVEAAREVTEDGARDSG